MACGVCESAHIASNECASCVALVRALTICRHGERRGVAIRAHAERVLWRRARERSCVRRTARDSREGSSSKLQQHGSARLDEQRTDVRRQLRHQRVVRCAATARQCLRVRKAERRMCCAPGGGGRASDAMRGGAAAPCWRGAAGHARHTQRGYAAEEDGAQRRSAVRSRGVVPIHRASRQLAPAPLLAAHSGVHVAAVRTLPACE